MPNIGCMIAQRLTAALTGLGVDYQTLVDVIYDECCQIGNEHQIGDWIDMPNGDTYTKTYTAPRSVK